MKELGKQLESKLIPSIHQPVQFADAKVCLILPEDTPGWEIIPDRSLEVRAAGL